MREIRRKGRRENREKRYRGGGGGSGREEEAVRARVIFLCVSRRRWKKTGDGRRDGEGKRTSGRNKGNVRNQNGNEKKTKKKKTRNRVCNFKRGNGKRAGGSVFVREREKEKETRGGGISWVRTVILRHDWLCQEEISSLHIPLPSHLQGPGIKRWRTPPRAPLH